MAAPRAVESPPPLLRRLLEQLAAEEFATAHAETSGNGTLEFTFRGGKLRDWKPHPDKRPGRHLPRLEADPV